MFAAAVKKNLALFLKRVKRVLAGRVTHNRVQ